jgi:hypothetical protein
MLGRAPGDTESYEHIRRSRQKEQRIFTDSVEYEILRFHWNHVSIYVSAGPPGCGKSFLLVQAVNYAISAGWIVLYIPRGGGIFPKLGVLRADALPQLSHYWTHPPSINMISGLEHFNNRQPRNKFWVDLHQWTMRPCKQWKYLFQ